MIETGTKEATDSTSHKIRQHCTHWLIDEVKAWKERDLSRYKNKRRMNSLKYFDFCHEILRGKTLTEISYEKRISRSNLRGNLLQILMWVESYKKLSELERL